MDLPHRDPNGDRGGRVAGEPSTIRHFKIKGANPEPGTARLGARRGGVQPVPLAALAAG
jgi:hypothetical protein